MRPRDTSPEAWAFQMELMRRMTPAEKLQRTFEFSALVRAFGEAGLRRRHPDASDREIFLRSARLTLGAELYNKVYGAELPL
ncbi:MAG: hypothetical protein ABI759_19970 [Candidatus Solibacter sp.]